MNEFFVRYIESLTFNFRMFCITIRAEVYHWHRHTHCKAHIRILIDSEPLLHTDEAKATFGEFGIEAMPSSKSLWHGQP